MALVNVGKDGVIMKQSSKNEPEMLWMEKLYAKLFWNQDYLEDDPVLTIPLLSLHWFLDFGLASPTNAWKLSQNAVSSKSLPGPFRWWLGGPLIYSLWTLASLSQSHPLDCGSHWTPIAELDMGA